MNRHFARLTCEINLGICRCLSPGGQETIGLSCVYQRRLDFWKRIIDQQDKKWAIPEEPSDALRAPLVVVRGVRLSGVELSRRFSVQVAPLATAEDPRGLMKPFRTETVKSQIQPESGG